MHAVVVDPPSDFRAAACDTAMARGRQRGQDGSMTGIGPSLMMRISIVTGVIGAFVALSVRPASAEKLTLACTFESGDFDRERDVNQVIFDTDRPQVDLRVAQTMGTNNPVDWIFENNAARKDSIQMVSEGSKISVAAIRYGHAVVISFDRITGLLNWAWADGSRSFRYKCRG
jgi:hypothetical protein